MLAGIHFVAVASFRTTRRSREEEQRRRRRMLGNNNNNNNNRSTEDEYMNITYHMNVLENESKSEKELLLRLVGIGIAKYFLFWKPPMQYSLRGIVQS
mmetsp:Transcript_52018/g.125511  ORF Transcript_52018/g.125511 Transcript_52018/m.125511 type:complete len:98 (-) Transcript_52018:278-571(-)